VRYNEPKAIVWFNEVRKKDIATVSGKGANLGEMINAHIPVPHGFTGFSAILNCIFDYLIHYHDS